MVPSENFKILSGTPKEITKTADSGKPITSKFTPGMVRSCGLIHHLPGNFCPDCGTTLFRYGDAFGGKDGMRIIKAGILDDLSVINSIIPGAELFAPERVKWVKEIDEAKQLPAMP